MFSFSREMDFAHTCWRCAFFWFSALSSDLRKKQKSPKPFGFELFTGPSGETWTHDPLTPSQVRYQLRYTRLFCLLLFRIGVSFVILAWLQTKCKLFFNFFWKILKKIKMGWKGRGTDSQRQKRRRNDYKRFVAGFWKNGNKRKPIWGNWSDRNWGGGSFWEKGNSQNILDKLNVFL